MFASQNPDKAAKSFQPYAPKAATLANLKRSRAPRRQPPSSRRRRAEARIEKIYHNLKTVSVFKPSTDTAKFAEKIYVDVFGV